MHVAQGAKAGFALVFVVGTWVAMGELLQGLEGGWNKPWMIAWCVQRPAPVRIVAHLLRPFSPLPATFPPARPPPCPPCLRDGE